MKSRLFGVVGAVALVALHWTSANASTVLAANDGTVNFLFDELGGAQLGLFDNDLGIAGSVLNVPLPSTVSIAPDGSGDFIASTGAATLPLTDQPWFVLGVSTNGGNSWIADSGVSSLGADALRVFFQLDPGSAGSVVAVDVQLAPLVVVPTPAALWLFGCGLIGLLVTARRTLHNAAVA